VSQHDDPLLAFASAVGVTAAYRSWDGKPTRASREAVLAVLAALGHPVGTDREATERRAAFIRAWWAGGPPCAVAWDGLLDLPLRVPADADAEVEVDVVLEDGETLSLGTRLFALASTDHAWPDGKVHCVRHVRIALPEPGYHHAVWRIGNRTGEVAVIAAPSRSWGAPDQRPRGWGVFAPVYALRDRGRGGAGDLGSLGRLAAEVGRLGGRYVGTLPLLAAFLDQPFQPSPYTPASRLAWNELYLDLARAPGLEAAPRAQQLLADGGLAVDRDQLAAKQLIDYRAQYAWRRRVIDELASAAWAAPGMRRELEAFARAPHAVAYAAFRAVGERARTSWLRWPSADREAAREAMELDRLPETIDPTLVRTHLYAQWAMDRQLGELAAGNVALYLDLPVGVGRDSYDVFRNIDLFVPGASTGAPPDVLFVGGQDWGLPPLHPERIRASGWHYLAEVVRHHMRHAGMLRIDHVMGLHRLYWVPIGFKATDGVYISYAADEQWAMLCLESHRNRCAIAGEDLGTVPPEVPIAMREHGASGLFVRQFAMPATAGEAGQLPRPDAIACLNTHDTPTFAGWWAGHDITTMHELGLYTADQAAAERRKREAQKQTCVETLVAAGLVEAGLDLAAPDAAAAVMVALYRELAASVAHDVLVTIEDLWLEPAPQNVPGTSTERANWQRPWSRSVEDALANPAVKAVLEVVAGLRR
jgi:4-alpha-glucanotransferase